MQHNLVGVFTNFRRSFVDACFVTSISSSGKIFSSEANTRTVVYWSSKRADDGQYGFRTRVRVKLSKFRWQKIYGFQICFICLSSFYWWSFRLLWCIFRRVFHETTHAIGECHL